MCIFVFRACFSIYLAHVVCACFSPLIGSCRYAILRCLAPHASSARPVIPDPRPITAYHCPPTYALAVVSVIFSDYRTNSIIMLSLPCPPMYRLMLRTRLAVLWDAQRGA